MSTRERPADRGRRLTRDALRRLGREHRQARVSAGLSLRACAAASGASYPQLIRFERGELQRLSVPDVGAWMAVVGLELGLRAYPAGDPIRDRAQLALLERLHSVLNPALRWQTEVPLPIAGDRRAWDAEIRGAVPRQWRARVEAETSIVDGQALERKLTLKARDDPGGLLILLVADTRSNRQALPALRSGLRELLPARARDILMALRDGLEPPGSGTLVI